MTGYLRIAVNLIPGPQQAADGTHPFVDIDDFARGARLAEEARLDAVFFADSPGVSQQPRGFALDPLAILPALARETEHVGLVATVTTTYTHPYLLARSILSLDHISHGRAGWNIVTTSEPTVSQNFGFDEPLPREERYRRAAEYAEVFGKLVDSWQDDVSQTWDLANLRRAPIDHVGEFFKVKGPSQVPRSPQGRPVVFQAGGSGPGIDLAARFADAVFSVGIVESTSRDYRERVNKEARNVRGEDAQVLVLPGLFLTVGSTQDEARRLLEEAENDLDELTVGRFVHRYGKTLDEVDLDGPVPEFVRRGEAWHSIGFGKGGVDLAESDPDLTLRRFIVYGGGGHRRVFGTPDSIATGLVQWAERGAADGYVVFWESLTPFVDHVAPLLRERGALRRRYTGTTLRENLAQRTG